MLVEWLPEIGLADGAGVGVGGVEFGVGFGPPDELELLEEFPIPAKAELNLDC